LVLTFVLTFTLRLGGVLCGGVQPQFFGGGGGGGAGLQLQPADPPAKVAPGVAAIISQTPNPAISPRNVVLLAI
jgi:hypothetical protein